MRVPRLSFAVIFLIIGFLLTLTACGVDANAAPTLTPNAALDGTAAALFPTPIPTEAPTPTPVVASAAAESIARTLAAMQNAVFTRSAESYLSQVDLTDPIFATEHTRWVEDWDSPVSGIMRFDMALSELVLSEDAREVIGDLTINWTTFSGQQVSRGADFLARFTLNDEGNWRYAGEYFPTTIETDHFIVKSLLPAEHPQLTAFVAMLPDIFTDVTTLLDYVPQNKMTIKIFDNVWDMNVTIRLSMTTEIRGWNEPGESLKIMDVTIEDERVVAHELAHYITFEIAGTTRGEYPWWVSEGVSQLAASAYWTQPERDGVLAQVQARRLTNGLAAWDDMAVYETTPEELQPFAYTQGYAFLRFVTDQYGADQRNAWIYAMADQDVYVATEAVFEIPFPELASGFLDWLEAQTE